MVRINRSVFATFLISYFIVLALMASAFIALFSVSISDKKTALMHTHEDMVTSAAEDISMQLDLSIQMIDQYVDNEYFNKLINSSDPMDPYVRENILALCRIIKNDTRMLSANECFSVFFEKLDRAIADTGSSELRSYYMAYMADIFENENEWRNWIRSLERGRLYSFQDGSVMMGVSLPMLGTDRPHSAIVIKIDGDKLFASLENIQGVFQGAIEVIDREGGRVYALGDETLFERAETGDGVKVFTTLDAQDSFFLRAVVEDASLFAEASRFKNMYILILASCIVIGVLVSLFISMRLYQPVRRIADMVGSGKTSEPNEFKRIEQSVQNIIDERERLYSGLIHHSDDLRECEFRRVISGEANEAEARQLIERELMPGERGLVSFAAVGLNGENKNAVIRNMEAILRQHTPARLFAVGGVIAGVAVETDADSARGHIQGLYDGLLKLGFEDACIAVGEIVYEPLALVLSHRQAIEALDYGMLANGGVSFYAEMPEASGPADGGITLYDHMRLQDAIRSGKTDEAMSTFRWITDKYFPEEGIPLKWLKCRMFSLTNTLVAAVSELGVGDEDEIPVERLLESNSIRDLIREAESFLTAVCSRIGKSEMLNAPGQSRDRIMEYIHANYRDVNMNVASIAEHFKMNASYLSRMFKQENGDGVLDTIHKVRLMHVKQLLKETDLSLHDIRVNVGYPGEQTMFRAFKRFEGMTPTQYRQLFSEAEE